MFNVYFFFFLRSKSPFCPKLALHKLEVSSPAYELANDISDEDI